MSATLILSSAGDDAPVIACAIGALSVSAATLLLSAAGIADRWHAALVRLWTRILILPVLRLLGSVPWPRLPALPKVRVRARGAHRRELPPLTVRLADLIHGTREMPEDWTASAFPAEPTVRDYMTGLYPRRLGDGHIRVDEYGRLTVRVPEVTR